MASENYRSCLSRAYYAAFSKVNHVLIGVPVDKVRKRLDDGEKEGIHLKVVSEKLGDDHVLLVRALQD